MGGTSATVIIDTGACWIFLIEFFVKLSMVRGSRASWFWRHFLIDFLPSIPFGLIAMSLGVLDNARAGRALRLLRLFRLTRYARAIGFLARGFDRLGPFRRHGHGCSDRDRVTAASRTGGPVG